MCHTPPPPPRIANNPLISYICAIAPPPPPPRIANNPLISYICAIAPHPPSEDLQESTYQLYMCHTPPPLLRGSPIIHLSAIYVPYPPPPRISKNPLISSICGAIFWYLNSTSCDKYDMFCMPLGVYRLQNKVVLITMSIKRTNKEPATIRITRE